MYYLSYKQHSVKIHLTQMIFYKHFICFRIQQGFESKICTGIFGDDFMVSSQEAVMPLTELIKRACIVLELKLTKFQCLSKSRLGVIKEKRGVSYRQPLCGIGLRQNRILISTLQKYFTVFLTNTIIFQNTPRCWYLIVLQKQICRNSLFQYPLE